MAKPLGQLDGGLKEPRQASCPCRSCARASMAIAPGTPAESPLCTALAHRHRAAIAQEELGRGGGRRGRGCRRFALAGRQSAAKGAAADAAGPRLHEAEHHLHGHRRIDGIASGAQDAQPASAASGCAADTAWRLKLVASMMA